MSARMSTTGHRVMRLMLYKGRSWREKLLNAIPPTKKHRRYNSETVNGGREPIFDNVFMPAPRRPSVKQQQRPRTPSPSPPILTAEHKNALVGRYKVYMRAQALRILTRTIARWHEAAVVMNTIRRWENKTIERKQGQYLARVAAERNALLQTGYRDVQRVLLQRTLTRWQKRLQRYDEEEMRALQLSDKALQARTWKHWFFRACDRRTIEYRSSTIKLRVFEYWRRLSKEHQLLIQKADDYRRITLLHAIDHWRIAYADRESSIQHALRHDIQRTTSKCMLAWRHATRLSKSERLIKGIVSEQIIRVCMNTWWNKLIDHEDQQLRANRLRLRALFKAWQRETKASIVLATRNQILVSSHVHYWRLQHKGKQVEYLCKANLLHMYIQRWSNCTNRLTGRLEDAETVIQRKGDHQILGKYVQKMQARLATINTMHRDADAIYASTILKFALVRMRENIDEASFQIQRACKLEKQFSRRRTIRQWRSTQIVNLETEASQIRHDRDVQQLRYFFYAWNDRHLDLFEMSRVAGELEQASLAKSLCQHLYAKHLKRKQDRDTASFFYIHHSCIPLANTSLQRWKLQYQRNQERQDQALLMSKHFAKRHHDRDRTILRQSYRLWRTKLGHQPVDTDNSFERGGETTLVPWSSSSTR
ncbi:hypothetical protein MRB53_039211 [Persea americana]|nr:hypothetical protein MRB53_039211 [Persea americana]